MSSTLHLQVCTPEAGRIANEKGIQAQEPAERRSILELKPGVDPSRARVLMGLAELKEAWVAFRSARL